MRLYRITKTLLDFYTRLLQKLRWQLTTGKNVSQTEKDLKRLFPESAWNKLHLQIIFYGREHCTARGCDGTVCEICTTCFPERKRAVKTKKV